ncbi:MAG: YiiX/YebB-like N1pC/P60 family cysteine hydrolase [Lutibacter sp.]|uniref:YiiX/YebB-like N1pC/P60 family cysteine hydrolase n=1 Tax=Lutibacter sp. TaxID=1925666 RepID=UPI003858AB77
MNSSKEAIQILKSKKSNFYFFSKHCFALVFLGLISSQFVLSQSSEISFNANKNVKKETSSVNANFQKYLALLKTHQLLQHELKDSTSYFHKIRNRNYVLTGKDINVINLEFSKRIAVLNESIILAEIDDNLGGNLLFNNLIATHLKIKSLETFLLQQKVVGDNETVDNLINEENKFYRIEKKSLKKIKRILISRKFRKSILESWNRSKKNSINTIQRVENKAIENRIKESTYYQNFLSSGKNIKKSKKYFRKLIDKKSSFYAEVNFNNFLNAIFSGLSNVVSNFMGIFATRKGELLNNNEFINTSLKLLQPLDIVLEKTPFRLTDKFIPGYWGHAAIYIGNESQLKGLGVWDNKFVTKYHKQIKEGKVIIEALRRKVECNTFKNFSNIDDYVHLRLVKELTIEEKRELIIRAFAQIGKKYDFGYDVESSKKIICSELLYITFDNVVFNTSKFMGISTISVDQIAEQGLKGGAFYPIDLYLDGIRIKEDKIFEIYDQLPTLKNKEIRKLKKSLHK